MSVSVMIVIGNKCDLEEGRRISLEEGQDFAASIGAFHFETSAFTSQGT